MKREFPETWIVREIITEKATCEQRLHGGKVGGYQAGILEGRESQRHQSLKEMTSFRKQISSRKEVEAQNRFYPVGNKKP
mgnify:CR=1 FL=1